VLLVIFLGPEWLSDTFDNISCPFVMGFSESCDHGFRWNGERNRTWWNVMAISFSFFAVRDDSPVLVTSWCVVCPGQRPIDDVVFPDLSDLFFPMAPYRVFPSVFG
jgi:hypothetical protein